LSEGIDKERLILSPSAVSIEDFRPSEEAMRNRIDRIKRGKPLRILFVGAISFQKGLWDLKEIIKKLKSDRFLFHLLGPISKEATNFMGKLPGFVQIIPKKPQHELPKYYAQADIFIFTTIQDGFAIVLSQAQASGLPIMTTTNCAGPDLIIEGKTGWILPIRNPDAFVDRLLWCDTHRKELAQMALDIYNNHRPKDWSNVARDFIAVCGKLPERQR